MYHAFLNDESGAVTVDWVVLTAAIVGLAIAVVTTVASGMNTLADSTSTELGNGQVATLDGLSVAGGGN